MGRPTEEQIREFWQKLGAELEHDWENEYCGHTISDCVCRVCHQSDWPPPTNNRCYPPITLDNLFRWAVPKLQMYELRSYNQDGEHTVVVSILTDGGWRGQVAKDPALALFWAIWKVMDKEV